MQYEAKNMNSKRIIAIIGAGASGITATKQCLDQGLDVVVFEKTNYSGGLWRYQGNVDQNGIASVMKSTIINTSKEMSAFSDFPPPEQYPNYMHNSKMVSYFDMYAQSFNFEAYVRYRTEIVSVEQADDYELTGRWIVKWRSLDKMNEVKSEIFDGVMICTGHHGTVNEPKLKGQDKFKGKVLHSHSLKSAQGFEDKSVVVVGIGNSGGDAAVELSAVAKQVYLSTRRGSWIFHRVGSNGQPLDGYFHRRLVWLLRTILPYSLTCTMIEWYLNSFINHEEYQLKPQHRCLSQHIMINDALPNRILSGTVAVKGDIDRFTEDGVIFQGETSVIPCDVVILATGYKVQFPFLAHEILSVNQNKVRLYKHQFVHNLAHPHTLALIGLVQSIGALIPISEMQSRWFALLMAGKVRLPSKRVMEADMAEKDKMQLQYYKSERHTFQVDWLPFMDELASKIGAMPPIWKYLFTDPKLFFTLIFGPPGAYQYRLIGPNKWSGARDALLTVSDRVSAALRTNSSRHKSTDRVTDLGCPQILLIVFIIVVILSSIVTFILSKIL